MKNITTYITESANKDSMFLAKTSRRSEDDFNFNTGERCFLSNIVPMDILHN